MEIYFDGFKKLVKEYNSNRIEARKKYNHKKILNIIKSDEFKTYYEEYKIKNKQNEEDIFSDKDIMFNEETMLNYVKNPLFYLIVFINDNNTIESIIDIITLNLVKIAFLFSCTKDILFNISLFEDDSDFLLTAFILTLENNSETVMNNFINSGILKSMNYDQLNEISIYACNKGLFNIELLKELIAIKHDINDIFLEFNIVDSFDVFCLFLESGLISKKIKDKKFETCKINSEIAKLFIMSGISQESFEKVFIKICSSSTLLIGKIKNEVMVDGIKYYKGDTIEYFVELHKDNILTRFIESDLMNKRIYNSGLELIDSKYIFYPALLADQYTDESLIKYHCKDKKLNELYNDARNINSIKRKKKILNSETISSLALKNKNIIFTGPHEDTFYIDEEKHILIGNNPTNNLIEILKIEGFNIIVNLTNKKTYNNEDFISIDFPIAQGVLPGKKKTNELINELIELVKEYKIYIHCSSGNGRSCMIASILYGKINQLSVQKSIIHIENCIKYRENKAYEFVPVPETQKQVDFIGIILGVEDDIDLQDRTDTYWLTTLKELKLER